MTSINDIEQVQRNLWKYDGKYYRLFSKGVSPNSCWLMTPVMKELLDISIDTGDDIYGKNIIEFDVCGTVPAHYEFIMSMRCYDI